MRVALLLLACAGCDQLFGIMHFDKSGASDGGTTSDSDAPMSDASTVDPGPPCVPQSFEGVSYSLFVDGAAEIAIAPDESYAIIEANGMLTYASPITAVQPTPIPSFTGTNWTHPAITADGKELLAAQPNQIMHASVMSIGQFGLPSPAPGLANDALPGTPSRLGNVQRMETGGNTKFDEYYRVASGDWSEVQSVSAFQLTGISGAYVASPSLTRDGHVLLFWVTNAPSGKNGIWFSVRQHLTDAFDASGSSVLLAEQNTVLATPYLTDLCNRLYVVDQSMHYLRLYQRN